MRWLGLIPGVVCLLFAFTSCGQSTAPKEITEKIERSEYRPPVQVHASSEERFQKAMPEAQTMAQRQQQPDVPPAAELAQGPLDYDVPEGWRQLPATQFRNPNFVAGPSDSIECYVSVLPGGGGGLVVNANRWRRQMGAPPLTGEEFAALPTIELLGHEAAYMDVTGTFTGMDGRAIPNQRLLGALVQTQQAGIFVKMVGPDEAVQEEREAFEAFVRSLRPAGTDPQGAEERESMPEARNPETETDEASQQERVSQQPAEPNVVRRVTARSSNPRPSEPAMPDSAQGISWEAPASWTKANHDSPMRLVTYNVGPNGAAECYVTVLAGTGGGRLNNMNRWLGQLGQPPLEESELELQPTLLLFGDAVPLLIASGTYTSMFDTEPRPDHALLGATAELADRSVFIKMIGPEPVVSQEWNRFHRFCASFEEME